MSYFKYMIIIIFALTFSNISAEISNFEKGKNFFDKKKYDLAKFKFEKDIVFNPKSENSYLYLAKIHKLKKDDNQEEKNLNTVILLNPKNEEAIYLLMDIEIERSNFDKVKKLKKDFELICTTLCPKISSIDEKLKNFDTKEES